MKITSFKTELFLQMFDKPVVSGRGAMPGRDILLLTLTTDEGIEGYGFITGLHLAQGAEIKVLRAIVDEALQPCVLGEDPLCIERLWNRMYQSTRRFGRRGAVMRAISAADMALWDILGKHAGLPLHKLLGGHADSVACYVSGGHYGTDEELVSELQGYLQKGYRAVKIRVGRASLQRDTERVRLARQTLGDAVELYIDVGEGWRVPEAMIALKQWEPFRLGWVEEPLSSDNREGLVRLRECCATPIAVGENEFSRYDFRDLISLGAVDIIQADVSRVGGVSEWMKIAHYASAHDIPMAPHGLQEIHVSLLGAIPNAMTQEIFVEEHPFQQMISKFFIVSPRVTALVDGRISMPDAPGLGLSIDWDYARQHQVS